MHKSFPVFGGLLISIASIQSHANPLKFGDASTDTGEIQVSGWLRANIQDKSYSDDEHKLKFDAAKLDIKYDSRQFFGNLEYRCYQFDTICDFSSLVNANLGYKISPTQRVTVGVQDVPFGPGRGWSTSWYGGLLVNTGLEDIHNLGINYQQQWTNTKLDLAYFTGDAGNYVGKSQDASRYTANFVKPDSTSDTYLDEKNMFVARISQDLPYFTVNDFSVNVGASYWYSDIDNKTNGQTGHRDSWALFSRLAYKGVNVTLTGGKNKITNKDPLYPDYAVVGSFDSAYYVANEGQFYTADVNYTFKNVLDRFQITPYATYTAYDKSHADYKTSTRSIFGAQLDYKKFSVASEYIIGKNDLFIGGDAQSFAQGDTGKSNKLFNLLFLYNF
ncbi:hypothetical protein [Acinetobacter puyangensis]|uniref:hypothetical protein n=1 Tax=Acinetobacter puyangensis TaxID=1096779 RepID=UPI003A4D964D